MIIETKHEKNVDLGYLGAFSNDKSIIFRLRIPRSRGISEVFMHLSADGLNSQFYDKIALKWVKIDGSDDVYEVEIDLSLIGLGLYYYTYEFCDFEKSEFYGKRALNGEIFLLENRYDGAIQLTVYKEEGKHPNWIKGGTMYHIFVDRFAKSGKFPKKESAIINDDWYNGIPQFPEFNCPGKRGS